MKHIPEFIDPRIMCVLIISVANGGKGGKGQEAGDGSTLDPFDIKKLPTNSYDAKAMIEKAGYEFERMMREESCPYYNAGL